MNAEEEAERELRAQQAADREDTTVIVLIAIYLLVNVTMLFVYLAAGDGEQIGNYLSFSFSSMAAIFTVLGLYIRVSTKAEAERRDRRLFSGALLCLYIAFLGHLASNPSGPPWLSLILGVTGLLAGLLCFCAFLTFDWSDTTPMRLARLGVYLSVATYAVYQLRRVYLLWPHAF